MNNEKIKVGITHGDTNGIGYEVILKLLEDVRLADLCTIVLYGSAKAAGFYRKGMDLPQVQFTRIDSAADARDGVFYIINVVGEDLKIDPGTGTEASGKAALAALEAAVSDLKAGDIDVLVTAPINKHAIQSPDFHFTGHTEYLEAAFRSDETPSKALMILCADKLRVALLTTHTPIAKVAASVTKEAIVERLDQFDNSLRRDFGIPTPRIAVLSLNPHAGEDGLLGDEEQTVADGIAETSFTETLPNNGLKTLSYKVVVSLNGNSSEAVESNKVKIGRLDLPFADSFAGGELSENWETEIVSGTYNWTIGSTANYPTTEPFDADGGLIYYPSFNAQAGQTARLITVPLSRESANSPVLQFYLCHSNMGNDKVQVQVSCDNGAWVDVEGEMPVVKGDKGVWEQYLFPLSGALTDGCKSFRVSLTAVSAYGHNIVVDNVRIFNLVDYDLEAVSLVGADKVLAGNDVELTLTIANNGGRDVSAGDYLIHVTSDLGTEIVSPASADIKSMETAALTVKVPVNAVHALAAESYIFKAEIDYPSDEVAGNNVTADKVVALGLSENDCVKSLSISADASGNKVLSWEPAGDPTYQPVNISESFEEFEKDAAGSFNGIVVLDLDGKSGGTNYGASGSAFTVSEHNSTYPKNEDGSKYIALTLPASTQQDDWVILPAVSCKASSTMTLSFMVALKAFYSSVSYYNYSYEVVYSTGDYDAANPSAAFTNLIKKETSSSTYGDLLHNDSFIEMTYENIPAEARHVAIHFTTKTGAVTAVCVDNIRLTEVDCARLLGYHVYEHQVGRINAEMLGADVTTFSLSQARFAAPSLRSVKDPVRQYFVTAVYPDGESMPSNIVSDGNMSGVENVADAASEVTAVAGGIVIKCGGEETVEVYDVAGRLVVAATCDGETFIPLHASVYVVKVGDAVAGKVLVK